MRKTFALRSVAAALLGAASAAALAQASPPSPPSPPSLASPPAMPAMPDTKRLVELAKRQVLDERFLAELDEELAGLPASMAFVANEFGRPREIVKNAPYTAEAVTESIQVLPDGNRIVNNTT